MGVEKQVIKPGNGSDYPKKHDEVSMEYTGTVPRRPHRSMSHKDLGWLFDDAAPNKKGNQQVAADPCPFGPPMNDLADR
jgi:FK506-binding protein 1